MKQYYLCNDDMMLEVRPDQTISNDQCYILYSDYLAEKEGKADNPEVEKIYKAYPTRDWSSGRSLGKCAKDKKRIAVLLRSKTADVLLKTIARYAEECKITDTYMKNFSTFLGNLPEYDFDEPYPIAGQPVFHGVTDSRGIEVEP